MVPAVRGSLVQVSGLGELVSHGVRKAQTRDQYPGRYPDVTWPVANAVLHGTTSSAADQFTKFVDEGQKVMEGFRVRNAPDQRRPLAHALVSCEFWS